MNPYSLNICIFNQILQQKHSSHVRSFKQILYLICFPKGEKDVLSLIYSENIFPFSIQVETIVNKFIIVFNPGTVEFIRYILDTDTLQYPSFHPTLPQGTLPYTWCCFMYLDTDTLQYPSFHPTLPQGTLSYTWCCIMYLDTDTLQYPSFHPTLPYI